jgi:DNA-binding response OmpR family regulator
MLRASLMTDRPLPARVVLAEDDAALLGLLDRALSAAGFEVLTAHGGWALHARLTDLRRRDEPPSAIVSDVHMPGPNGISIARLVRDWGWDTPIVLCTAFPSERKLTSASEAGATLVVAKPFAVRDLVLAVTCLCPGRAA